MRHWLLWYHSSRQKSLLPDFAGIDQTARIRLLHLMHFTGFKKYRDVVDNLSTKLGGVHIPLKPDGRHKLISARNSRRRAFHSILVMAYCIYSTLGVHQER